MSDKLEQLQKLGKQLEILDEQIEIDTGLLSELLQKAKKIREEVLPQMLMELGLEEIKLSSGSVITLEKQIQGRMVDEDTCLRWLHQNGHEAIVKNEYKVNLRAGENSQPVEEALKDAGIPFSNRMTIHAATLKKFLRERLEAGDDIPMEAFGVHEIRQVKFKNVE